MMMSFLKFHSTKLTIGLILVLTFLIYAPALRHEFINLDDGKHITENPQIRSLSPESLKRIFTSTVQRTYIPLTIFSFALEYHLVGNNPFLYHLNNILLHLIVVFLIFRLGMALGLKSIGACFAAFVFALHPMHVESVVWATERKDVLYSVFYLASVLGYLQFLKSRHWEDYSISLGMGLLSILAKPMALSLPLILLACDWFYNGSFKKEDWFNKIPYGLLVFPFAWITYSINTGIVGQNSGPGSLLRFWAGAFYLKKFFWPILFVPHYIPALPMSIFRFEYWSSIVVIGASLLAFWKYANRWFRLAFLWYFFSIFFLLNLDYSRVMQMVADRYMYLPSAGFCFLGGYALQKVWKSKFFSTALGKTVVATCLLILAVFLSVKTFYQVGIWKNSFVFWNYTIEHTPTSFLAFNNRGRIYEARQQFDLALADYKQAVQLNPHYAKAHKNLAMTYERLGDADNAFASYSKAIELNGKYSGAYNNRALLAERKGDYAAALKDYDSAVAANSNYLLGYSNRGALLMKLGKMEQAVHDFTTAIELKPHYLDAYKNRAICYLQMNILPQALQDCRQAISLKKSDPIAHLICSDVYQRMGKYHQALEQAQHAQQVGYPVDERYLQQLKAKIVEKPQ